MTHRTHRAPALALLLLLAFAGSVLATDSPETAFQAARAAIDSGDYAKLVDAVAPSERTMMAFSLTMGVDMAVSFWEGDEAAAAQETFQALQSKHSVKDDDEGPELAIDSSTTQEEIDAHMTRRAESLFSEVDVEAYVAELLAFFLTSPMMEGQELFPSVALTDVKIDGDRAKAKAGDAEIEFLREGGRWYLASP